MDRHRHLEGLVMLRTTLQAPSYALLERASIAASRYRAGAYGEPRDYHNPCWLTPPDGHAQNYAIRVWGDPAGHVRAYAEGEPDAGTN
jgi:hypothetical protein